LAQAETVANEKRMADQRDEQTLLDMNARNLANLAANRAVHLSSAYTLSVAAPFWGDSLVEDVTGSLPSAYRGTTIVGGFLSGTVSNKGIGGQTSSQITARVVAGTSDEKAGLNFVMMGANDTPASKAASAILTDYATCVSNFTNSAYVLAATWHTSVRRRDRDVWVGLRSTYGANALDMVQVWARYAAGSGDAATSRQVQLPLGLGIPGSDTLHNGRAGGVTKGNEWAMITVARNGGAPYVHDDIIGMKNGDASGTSIITPRALGETLNWSIIAGNEDDAVAINRTTGEITRTGNAVLQPYREVFVEAENHRGKGRNGRIIIVRQMDGTSPQAGVEVLGNGHSYAQMPSTYAPSDSTGMTVVICARLNLDRTNGNLLASSSNAIIAQNTVTLRFTPRAADGSLRGDIILASDRPSDWNFYFFSIDTAGNVRGALNETTSSASATAGNIGHSTFTQYFTNSNNSLPFIGGLKMLAIYNQYYDVHDSAVRTLFYDSTTRLPKDIGDGTAGGALAAPAVYLRGMAGDYILGKNFGTAGDLHVPVPFGRRHLGFVDAAL